MVKQIVNHTVCLCVCVCARSCWCLFLIHTFRFCESTCWCPVLSSPDRHGGNQRADIFVKKREGTGEQKGRRSMIHSIHVMFFFFLFQRLVSLTGENV